MSIPAAVLNGEVWGPSRGPGTQGEQSKGQLSPLHFSSCIPKSFLCPLFHSGFIATLEGCLVVVKICIQQRRKYVPRIPTCLLVFTHLCRPHPHWGEPACVTNIVDMTKCDI